MPDPLKVGVGVSFQEAISAALARGVVLPEVYYGEMQGLARQLAFSIAGIAKLDQLQAIKDSLDAAIAEGKTFAQWQNQAAAQALELPRHRLDNIFRTNIQSNYNRGRWQRFIEVKHARPYLMYDAINDARVRPSHLAMDGLIRPVDDAVWITHAPCNGYRCRCRLISLTESQARARSGVGQGLNKPVDLDAMRPDEGWDYNPGATPMVGVTKAVIKRGKTASLLLFTALVELLQDFAASQNSPSDNRQD